MIMWHLVPDWSKRSLRTDQTEVRGSGCVHTSIVHNLNRWNKKKEKEEKEEQE